MSSDTVYATFSLKSKTALVQRFDGLLLDTRELITFFRTKNQSGLLLTKVSKSSLVAIAITHLLVSIQRTCQRKVFLTLCYPM